MLEQQECVDNMLTIYVKRKRYICINIRTNRIRYFEIT